MTTGVRSGVPIRRSNVWLRQAASENVIVEPDSGSVHILNATALAIWVLCDGSTAPAEMVDAICELSGLPEAVVNEDVERTLARFSEIDIVRWEESDARDQAEDQG
jgi:Coenzyme PQQ synthesis protein D (PqqD)